MIAYSDSPLILIECGLGLEVGRMMTAEGRRFRWIEMKVDNWMVMVLMDDDLALI